MGTVPRSTIEQWAVLRAVVEQGGFAAAADKLNRSQSSVSYAVARLQEATGVDLLEIRGRRAFLTSAGAALLAEAVPLIDDLLRIERRAHAIARGHPESIRLVVDGLFPKDRLFYALVTFARQCPDTEVHLTEAVKLTLGTIMEEQFDLAVLYVTPGAHGIDTIAEVSMLAVAHKDHPLIRTQLAPGLADLARYPCVEFQGQESPGGTTPDAGRLWRMSTVDSAIEAVRNGLCYGWLPQDRIQAELQDGTLCRIPLPTGGIRKIPLALHRAEQGIPEETIETLARLLAENQEEAATQDDGPKTDTVG